MKVHKVLLCWVGRTDLRAPGESEIVGLGPIAQALDERVFDEVVIISDYPDEETGPFVEWLRARTETLVELVAEPLSSPTAFGEIYQAAVRQCERIVDRRQNNTALTFHLSPGSPAMAAVWILIAKARFPAELIESSRAFGVRTAEVPFNIAAEFVPDLLRVHDERLRELSAGAPPSAPEFAEIIHRSRVMKRLIQRATKVAVRNVPVLIEGESGTGKEMLARAIHQASPRGIEHFRVVNCGAIPAGLVESELFGTMKGTATGVGARKGYFEDAHRGTLFLDEIGELPGEAQVKMLRVLQENEIVRLGATQPIKIDVRIIAATNRTLSQEVIAGRFREDLFYRLAVAVLTIPSVRERPGDLGLLIDELLDQVNAKAEGEPGYFHKKLSVGARKLLLAHTWPGNVRELLNTLRRAAIWSDGATITVEDVREAILPGMRGAHSEILGRALGNGFDLRALMAEVARHYLERALAEAGGNKRKATGLVGLPSYQTLTNWLKRYQVADVTEME